MMRRFAMPLVGASLVCHALASTGASAEESAASASPPAITVEGTAATTLTPDTATLSLGVVTTRPKASDAVSENSRALAGAVAFLKAQGIPPDAITTTALELSPVSDAPPSGAPKIVGYAARNEIEVHLKTAQDIGALAATLIDKGVNAIDGLTFESSAEPAARDRLKGEAARAARHDAELYATALGLKLGRVLAIRPDAVPDAPYRAHPHMAARAAAAAPVPVSPGRLDIVEHVAVTFELTP